MDNGSLGHYLRTRWLSPRRVRFWLLTLVVLYTLLGFLAVPWLLQYVAVNTAREDFGRELRIDAVHLNPYTLTFRIDGLALDDTDDRKLLGWKQLFVSLSWSSVINRAWTFQTIRLDSPVIQEERFTSGETRFSRLFPAPADKAPEEEESGSLPALRVGDMQVNGAVLRFFDNFPDETTPTDNISDRVSLALRDVDLSLEAFSLQEGARFPFNLGGQLAGGGQIALDGTLGLLPTFSLEGEARIDELALAQAEPYLRQLADVRIGSGALNLDGQMRTAAQEPFSFNGSAGIDELHVGDGSGGEPLIGWGSVRTEQLALSLGDRQVETAPITVDGLSGRVVIHEDRTTNFGQLMVEDKPSTSGEEQSTKPPEEGTDPFDITVEGINVTDGALQFADNSLPLPFSTSIHSLGGQISTLNSTSAQPAQVDLEGQVADYGLARVGGSIHAWNPMRETNLALSFRNLEIPEYSPYTVQFAGRKIAGGTMDLDLDYKVSDRRLNGSNNLVLRELKLGEKMASSDAMDLPLDLAIALLKDRNGVIDLELPVNGNVGEPEFDIGHLIRQTLNDTLMSIVQSPFRFLASLVGADSEALNRIEFPEGRSDLMPPQRERIAKLREALHQRPELQIEFSGPYDPALDGPQLRRTKAVEALKRRLAEAGRDVTDPSLTAESTQDTVEAMFTTDYPEKDLEAVRARFTEQQDGASDETAFDGLAYRNHLAEQVIAAQPVTDADLAALGKARATAVRDTLIDTEADSSIAADRVRLLEPSEVDSAQGERVTMHVGVAPD